MRTDDDPPAPSGRGAAAAGRVQRRRDLSGHLAACLAVNGTLWTSWLVVALGAGTWFPWPLVPTAATAIGLVLLARRAPASPVGGPDG